MIDISQPEQLAQYAMDLDPVDPERGTTSSAGTRLSGRILVGGPMSVRVTSSYVDEDVALKAYVEQEADVADYHLVHLSVTCRRPEFEPPLQTVSVDLGLSADPAAAFQPIAWSMSPRREADTVHTERSLTFGPQLKLFGAEVQIGEVGMTQAVDGSRTRLEALRELRSDPGWELRRTPTSEIDGLYRLTAVIRAPRRLPVQLALTVGATLRRGPVMRHFRKEVPQPLCLSVEL